MTTRHSVESLTTLRNRTHGGEIRTGLGNPDAIRVLRYGDLRSGGVMAPTDDGVIPESSFRRHLELLDGWGYTSITFNEYRKFLSGDLNLPRKPVIITFDHPTLPVIEVALPLMQRFGMRGVVFALGDLTSSTASAEKGETYLTGGQLIDLYRAGFEIGSVTMTRPNLEMVTTDAAWSEISQSRVLLETLLNAPVRSFAYPHGRANPALKNLVREAGYTIACAAMSGPPVFGGDPFEVRRITPPTSGNSLALWLRLRPAAAYAHWFIRSMVERPPAPRIA